MHNKAAWLIFFILGGCVSPPATYWYKQDVLTTDFDRDKRECNYDAQRVFHANINSPMMGRYLGEETYKACMIARGYAEKAR